MKLSEAVEIAKGCDLKTYSEVYLNISMHKQNLFEYESIEEEMKELLGDIKQKYNKTHTNGETLQDWVLRGFK